MFKRDDSWRNVWRPSDGRNRGVWDGVVVMRGVGGSEIYWVLFIHVVVVEVVTQRGRVLH